MQQSNLHGAGLGLRRAMFSPSFDLDLSCVDFMEVAPENWINVGGRFGKAFRHIAEQVPVTLHGLSLDLGGFRPIDIELVNNIRQFIADFNCPCYSEHLSYCADEAHLYDLMPIPFTEEAVKVVVARINQVQDILGQRMAIENVSYYAAPYQQISEIEFINAVVSEADCDLLLDVNNIMVNAINHKYDPVDFLKAMPGDRTAYIHIAGHYKEAEDLRVDTHGADVIEDVWALLEEAYKTFGVLPTLLERDFNIPAMQELTLEIDRIHRIQQNVAAGQNDKAAHYV